MADEQLRRHERRAAAGDPEAAARWLAQQLRVGAITRPRVELAAYLGLQSARACLDEPPELLESEQFLRGLEPWGREVATRAAIFLARRCLPTWEAACPEDARPARAIEAAQAWLDAPDAERQAHAEEVNEEAFDAAADLPWEDEAEPAALAACAAGWAAAAAGGEDLKRVLRGLPTDEPALEALRAALLAWALEPASREGG